MPFLKGSRYGLTRRARASTLSALVPVDPSGYLLTDSIYSRLYGPGTYIADDLGNFYVDANYQASGRFRATSAGDVTGVRVNFPAGPGYAAGNGGTCRARVYPDDGTGKPNTGATAFATGTQVLGMSGGNHSSITQFHTITMTPASPLVRGTLYHVVFDNTGATPASNWHSVNSYLVADENAPALRWGTTLEYGGLEKSGATWTDYSLPNSTGWVFFPILQVNISGQPNIGSAIIEGGNRIDTSYTWNVGSANPIRERFTPTSDKTVIGFSIMTCASTGGNLLCELKQGATVLATKTIAQASPNYAVTADTNYVEQVWYDELFDSPVILSSGVDYDMTFTPQGSSVWVFCDQRNGSDYSFTAPAAFTESQAQHYYSGAWIDAYHWDHTSDTGASNWRVVLHLQ